MRLEPHEFGFEVEVQAPTTDAFRLLTDVENASQLTPAITKVVPLTDQPFGVGYRWRETRKMFLILRASADIEVTEYEPDSSYSVLIDDDCNWCTATFTVTPTESGCHVVYRGECKQYKKNRKTKQRELVPSPMMARMVQKGDKDCLPRLKQLLEAND